MSGLPKGQISFCVAMKPELADRIRDYARKNEMKIKGVVVFALEEYLKKHEQQK